MEDTLDQVTRHCAYQLDVYTRCVDRYPAHWDTHCARQRRALTSCADQQYPFSLYSI